MAPGKVVSVTGLGDLKQLEAAFRKAGLVVSESADQMATSSKRAGEAAALAAKKQGASAEEQAAAAGRAAAAFNDAQARYEASARAAGTAAASAAKSAGLSADEQEAAFKRSADAAQASADRQAAAATKTLEAHKAAEDAHKKVSKLGGTILLGGTAALAAGGVAAIKLGEDFETAQAKIKGATGQSQKSVEAMTGQFRHMSDAAASGEQMEGAFSEVAGQLKVTEGHALSLGESMKFVAASNHLSEASAVPVGVAYGAVARTMQAFHLSAHQAGEASDVLYSTSQALHVPVEQVSTAMAKLHGRLGEVAPSMGDVAGLMVSLGQHGVVGSRGVQVVNTAFQTLLGGSKKTDETLKAVGVSVYNSSGKFVGMQNVIAQLQPKLAGMTDQQKRFVEQQLFGKGAAEVLGQVIKAGVPAYQQATDAATRHNAALKAAEAQSHTLRGETEQLRHGLETLGGSIGLALIPKVTALAHALLDGIQWLDRHKEAAKALAIVITTVLGAAVAVFVYDKTVAFTKGVERMVTGLKALMGMSAETAGAVEANAASQAAATEAAAGQMAAADEGLATKVAASDDAIVASNEAAGASFTAMLGPIAAVVAAVAAAQPEINKLTGGGLGESASNDKNAGKIYEEQYGGRGKQNVLDKGGGIMGYFMSKGLSAAQAAGIVGNVEQESSFNPNAPGGGLFQDIGGRGAGQGAPVSKQLAKAWEELTGPYASVLAELKKAKTPAEAARIFSGSAASGKGFERPGKPEFANRERYAEEVFRSHPQPGASSTGGPSASTGSGGSNSALEALMHEAATGKAKKQAAEPYVVPLPGLTSVGRTDEGVDFTAKAGSAVQAIGSGVIDKIVQNWFKGQPLVEEQLTSGTRKGQHIYYAEQLNANVREGQHVAAGQRIGTVAASGTGLEIGFGAGGGRTLAQATTGYKEGEATIAGKQFESFLKTLGKGGSATSVFVGAAEQATKALEKLRKAHEAEVKVADTKGLSTFRKYETELQTGGVKPLEKLLGTHQQAIYRAYLPAAERLGTTTIPGGGPQQKEFNTLITALRASHVKGLQELAGKLVTVHHEALSLLSAELAAAQESADARKLQLETVEQKDLTTIAQSMANRVVQAMKDAAQTISDSFSAAATAIKDQTREMSDASAAAVTSIQDQSQITVDRLAERGLYGLNLVAQKQQVGLDEMKAGFDAQAAKAQQSLDQAQTATDKASAATQAIVDAVTTQQDALIGQAQQNLNNVTSVQDRLVQEAQNKVAAASTGTQAQQQIAQAALLHAEAAAAAAEQQAQAALSSAESNAARAEQEAQNAVASAHGNAEVVLAQAEQALAQAQNQANTSEAEQQALIEKTKAEAATQYAGSGLNVTITGINPTDSAAIASEVGWLLRTQIPAVVPA